MMASQTLSFSRSHRSEIDLNDLSNVDLTLMTLRKPTPLKKVIDSIPMPTRAVPKNGLPVWYRLGLQCKLPVPKMPTGKIVFSRGRIGEDIIGQGLGPDCPRPSFDLTDPYCNEVNYDYDSMHDPHMTHHYNQKPARNRMKELGFCTDDNRAVCSLKQFNDYRKYLYIRFMDRIRMEMIKLDERAKDDTTLKKVHNEIARQALAFQQSEKVREYQEKHNRIHAEELAEKRRLAKEQEKKIEQRMKYLQEHNEMVRKKQAEKHAEHKLKLRQRIQAAAELELRRKIGMIRQWRINERRRVARVKQDATMKKDRLEKEAEDKWNMRIATQNRKVQEQQILLKLYQDDMNAAAHRRVMKAQKHAHVTNLQLQRIKLRNIKELHGLTKKQRAVVRKIGIEFGKAKRGTKGMTVEMALEITKEKMALAREIPDDTMVNLGVARILMERECVIPTPPLKILDMLLEGAIMEFTRHRVHVMLKSVEREVRNRGEKIFFQNFRPSQESNRSEGSRWLNQQLNAALTKLNKYREKRATSIAFGEVSNIPDKEQFSDRVFKSARDRTPTPVPSFSKLAEVTFGEKLEDLPEASTHARGMLQRRKLIEMVNYAGKVLIRTTFPRVETGLDIIVGKVTMPFVKHPMEWGEAVEAMANTVMGTRVAADSADMRQTTLYLASRILRSLQHQMKQEKKIKKLIESGVISPEEGKQMMDFYDPSANQADFYVPGQVTIQSGGPGTPQKK